ncbi:iron-containing alcohol dehydrogenase [Seohaeicola zhoushanensis]|uniref:Maleylacetate reductase n=1 Tax=Seohaeicola zhoushanensis TaxID=1569283 RepID=A0A8J3H0B0_9RHOB|nr:iron-containing alcohol dehydrogenase [Seohaeicola zhoushanensis]GHF62364.1 maleylacetate reductase [Seohaeicola zhoushanensis]
MFKGRYTPPQRQIVIYGEPLEEMLPKALSELWARQTVLVTSQSLAGPKRAGGRCGAILGDGCTDRIEGIGRDAPFADVMNIVGALRHKGTEAMVAVGGGSVAEAAKSARICLTNNVAETDDLARLALSTTSASPRPYLISVPTTLSGAEYTPAAGFLNPLTGRKQIVSHADLAADIVLLDPTATLDTPEELWLSSGLRAVDHAIATWCSAAGSAPMAEASALQGLRLLTRGLRASKARPEDLNARQDCQLGSWQTIQGAAQGVRLGPSHAIGRPITGQTGLPQGVASAILLPHVLRYTAPETSHLHAPLAEAMGSPGQPLADTVAELVKDLGLPTRLGAQGVPADALEQMAEEAMLHPELQTGGRRFDSPAQVLEVLRSAW